MPEIVTYYLEMKSSQMLKEKPKPDGCDVLEAKIKQYRVNRFLYQLVGESWNWNDKDSFSDEQWKEYSEKENLRTWIAYYRGSICGYFELERQPDSNVEITYFGLAPGFIGKGFGGYLLSYAIKSAWAWGDTKRIWLHTCSLDHESALNNYTVRGFEVYHESKS
jgi:GNAT superfamily N-acetyltransferase